MSLADLSKRIGAAARAAGVEGVAACEDCARSERLRRESERLRESLGLPDPTDAPRLQMRATCCGRDLTIRAVGFTPADCERFQRWEALYWQGAICSPEFVGLNDWLRDKLDSAAREQYGQHAPAFAELYAEHQAAVESSRQAPIPYLCRVPGCRCAYPKTLAAWRENVRSNGVQVPACVDT